MQLASFHSLDSYNNEVTPRIWGNYGPLTYPELLVPANPSAHYLFTIYTSKPRLGL